MRTCPLRGRALVAALLAALLLPSLTLAQPDGSDAAHSYERMAPGAVFLKNGRTLEGTLSLERPGGEFSRLLYITPDGVEERLKPAEVRAFQHGDRYVVNHALVQRDTRTGVRVEERFLERRVDGPRLDLYAPLGAQSRYPYAYFEKEGGATQKVNYKNLRVALRDDPESAALIQSSRTWRTVQYGMLAGGAAAYFTSIAQANFNDKTVLNVMFNTSDPLFYAGIGTMALSLVPHLIKRAKFRKAVRTYNR